MSESNGPSGSLSFADRLREKHADHAPTVEETVDEEDIIHPPPSAAAATAGPVLEEISQPLSDKAIGKKKAQDDFPKASSAKPGIDTKSETAFPALGGGLKPRTNGPVAPAWGAKKSTPVTNGAANGVNGYDRPPASSTPPSGPLASGNQSAKIQSKGPVSMPGRQVEKVHFAPQQLLKRTELKKPISEVLRDINKRSKAKVELKQGAGDGLTFEGTGPLDAVRQALKDVAKEVGSKVKILTLNFFLLLLDNTNSFYSKPSASLYH